MSNKDYKEMYMVVELGERLLGGDIEECRKITCTNKSALHQVTKIGYYRLVYVFKKQGRSVLMENGWLILKSNLLIKGSQPGGDIKGIMSQAERNF